VAPVSPAADFAQPESKEITLPATQNGKAVTVRIRAVPVVRLLKALEGIPQLSRGENSSSTTFEQARGLIAEQDVPMRKVAEAGILAPKFVFDGSEPKVDEASWDNVRFENQKFIVSEIMDFSGFTATVTVDPPGPVEAAAQAEEFRGVAAQ
jgi:hypothetical protein